MTTSTYTRQLGLCLLCVVPFVLAFSTPARAEDPADAATSLARFCEGYPRPAYAELQRVPYDGDSWFELYAVAEGVTAIYEPHQWQEVISYLIEGEDSALLFDSGNGIGDIRAVVDALTSKPVTVLNSHGHFDHVGGNFAFDDIAGMDTRFTRERQMGQPNEVIALEASAAALCRPAPRGVTEANHVGRPYRISTYVNDGHSFDLGGRTLEVVTVPGHTPDAIVLVDRDAGLMWTGDTYYAGPIWLYALETDLAAYRKSLEKLILEARNIEWLMPAHNTPRVSAAVLPDVLTAYDAMIAGEATPVHQGDGMVEYHIEGESRFSFLMRDEPLPYSSITQATVLANTGPASCAEIIDGVARLACFDAYFTPVVNGDEETSVVEQIVQAELEPSLIMERRGYETAVADQFFALTPHDLNYVLPATMNTSSDYSPYGEFGETFNDWEIKFQLSLKAMLAENLWRDSSIWVAYTQQAYWQLYADEEASAPFRETNYQPEIFWSVPVDFDVLGWNARVANVALNHQSNGRGEPLSRSWNRITGELVFDRGPFAANIKTWYRLPEDAENDNNSDIEDYMGRVELGLAYKRGEQLFGLGLKNNLSSDNRSGLELNWTFPLVQHLRGFVQIYSGYGENLIDAENYTNRVGIGVALSDRL